MFARVLESARRHQPLIGTLFRVDAASPAADSVAVRLPPWVGRRPTQADAGQAQRAAKRAPRGRGQPQQSSMDSVQPSAAGVTGRNADRPASPERKSWATPPSGGRPGFPVQRSPAASPQKLPAAPSAAAYDSVDESSEHVASSTAGAGMPASTEVRQNVRAAASNLPGPQPAEPSATSAEAVVDSRTSHHDAASGVSQAGEAAAGDEAVDPADSSASQGQHTAEGAAACQGGSSGVSTVHKAPDEQHDAQSVALSDGGTQSMNSPESTESDIPKSTADPSKVKATHTPQWDGHDAALLAVIVEHAKVLHTINAGEAGSSCSLM